MAIAYGGNLGTVVGNAVPATTYELTTVASAPAGSLIVVSILNGESWSLLSVTDNAGNTYVSAVSADQFPPRVSTVYKTAATALPSGGVITVLFDGTEVGAMISASYFTGVASTSALDQSTSLGAASGGAQWGTPSITTDTAGELVFASAGVNELTTSSLPGNGTEIHDFQGPNAAGGCTFTTAWHIHPTASAVSVSGNWGVTTTTSEMSTTVSFRPEPPAPAVTPDLRNHPRFIHAGRSTV